MTVDQAVRRQDVISGAMWFRPKEWKGSGQALTFDYESKRRVLIVPDKRGGAAWNPTREDLAGDWEVVSPDIVNEER